jgi:hypothetical protein
MLARNSSARDARASFEVSLERVQSFRDEILRAMWAVRDKFIGIQRNQARASVKWVNGNPKYAPFFGVAGAVDGSHVYVQVPQTVVRATF